MPEKQQHKIGKLEKKKKKQTQHTHTKLVYFFLTTTISSLNVHAFSVHVKSLVTVLSFVSTMSISYRPGKNVSEPSAACIVRLSGPVVAVVQQLGYCSRVSSKALRNDPESRTQNRCWMLDGGTIISASERTDDAGTSTKAGAQQRTIVGSGGIGARWGCCSRNVGAAIRSSRSQIIWPLSGSDGARQRQAPASPATASPRCLPVDVHGPKTYHKSQSLLVSAAAS